MPGDNLQEVEPDLIMKLTYGKHTLLNSKSKSSKKGIKVPLYLLILNSQNSNHIGLGQSKPEKQVA